MADTYVQTCFAFRCTAGEWSLLQQAFLLSLDLCSDIEPDAPGPEFIALFQPGAQDDWAGFRDLFDDPAFPDFGADLAGGANQTGDGVTAVISAEASFDPSAVARLIQRCCAASLAVGSIGFEWSMSCARQLVGEFGGGWCAIFPDRIEIETTGAALSAAMEGSNS